MGTKGNPNHDPKTGEFSSGDGGGRTYPHPDGKGAHVTEVETAKAATKGASVVRNAGYSAVTPPRVIAQAISGAGVSGSISLAAREAQFQAAIARDLRKASAAHNTIGHRGIVK